MNSVKIMSKACEMFVLDLAMRSHQTKKLQDSESTEEEDVITVSTVRTITQTKCFINCIYLYFFYRKKM